jgi:S-adenosylmethionine decarboxylase
MTATLSPPTRADVPVSGAEMVDLAPEIYRQRLVVEGLVDAPIGREEIESYLSQLSEVLGMITVLEPVTHQSDKFGWAGWIHWETSGAHFYAWDQPRLFFSVDIYTCKWFSAEKATQFTSEFFGASTVVCRAF